MARFLLVFIGLLIHCESAPKSFDCPMRQLALEFAQEIQPFLTGDQLQEIADALNGSPEAQKCNISAQSLKYNQQHRRSPKWNDLNDIDDTLDISNTLFVDYKNGNDNHNGSISHPLQLLETAVYRLREIKQQDPKQRKRIILRQGTHYLPNTIYFKPIDSHLLITNYNGEESILSGGFPIDCNWKSLNQQQNLYSCDLSSNTNVTSMESIYGLRVNGERGVRARYPNNNPELGFGSKLLAKSWYPNTLPKQADYQFNPYQPLRNTTSDSCFQHYLLGVGKICESFYPPAGYFCSADIQGGGYGNAQCNQGALPYSITNGFTFNTSILPNSPYNNPSDAVIHVWRPGHWATWMFTINEYNQSSTEQSFIFDKGGFQGGRGDYRGDEFYVENIFEELDDDNEWFYDKDKYILYYKNNVTKNGKDIENILFQVTNQSVLMNFTGNGMNDPIKDIEIRGMIIKDTRYTYFYPHGLPSGGDWSLARIGAIYFDNGNKDIMINNNIFTRLDGNTISINQYARNITIYKNEIVWNGDNVVSVWGYTTYPNITNISTPLPTEWGMGYDGTNGNQPREINLIQNFVHEIGIWEKQSSMWFQAKSCSNILDRNIFFNGPRAGINFNDGFGGNSTMSKNLLFNTCRESGDHGPFNSWDRQVYLTKVNQNGTPSTIKQYDIQIQNFMIANYNSVNSIDNDDGSCYYKAISNFMVYGIWGLKSDYSGHNTFHYNNIVGYVTNMCFAAYSYNTDPQIVGYLDGFYNNTCIIDVKGFPKNYGQFDCKVTPDAFPVMGNNTVYINNGQTTENTVTGLCDMNEKDFQEKYNKDLGTVIKNNADDAQIIQQAKAILWS